MWGGINADGDSFGIPELFWERVSSDPLELDTSEDLTEGRTRVSYLQRRSQLMRRSLNVVRKLQLPSLGRVFSPMFSSQASPTTPANRPVPPMTARCTA